MNPSSLIGILGGLMLMATVIGLSANSASHFIDGPGLLLVLGGTFAATFMSYPLREVLRVFRLVVTVLRNERLYTKTDIDELVRIARLWSTGDIQAVEKVLDQVNNPFLKTGVQLVIDLTPEEDLIDFMQWRISRLRARELAEAQMFRAMATYAPAFGMIGTLVGLINLMGVLGDGNLAQIGMQLGIALITTFYGILLANLIFKPVAVKLERRTEQRVILMNMVLQGITMMCERRSPTLIRETLNSFVAHFDDEIRSHRVTSALADHPSAPTNTPKGSA